MGKFKITISFLLTIIPASDILLSMNKEEYNNSLYTKCDCLSHMLQTERYYFDEHDKGFNFSIWNYGHTGNIKGWKERFRWCWHILRTGLKI